MEKAAASPAESGGPPSPAHPPGTARGRQGRGCLGDRPHGRDPSGGRPRGHLQPGRRQATEPPAAQLAAYPSDRRPERQGGPGAGIRVVEVDERGTSSTCLLCRRRVPKPRGRCVACPHCGFGGHRNLVGAANIAAVGGGEICGIPRIEHRRVGTPPTRRDRRRHRHDERRSCLAHGRRESLGSRSRSSKGPERRTCSSVDRTRAATPAIGEDPPPTVLGQEGEG